MEATNNKSVANTSRNYLASQYSTFLVNGKMYAIAVDKVQEIVKTLPLTPVPHAPNYVRGLINLRGQIVTAIGLVELFETGEHSKPEMMNIICHSDQQLISLLVDQVGDVIELREQDFQATPPTLTPAVARVISGVAKADKNLFCIIDLEKLSVVFQQSSGVSHAR